mmetsp:Transcript_15176/g.57711  ORF Transcript_15176/g.57711 Transcript_15176/m.57711 type:complete len:278 (-) Transcript_15176:119-952(-)
MSPWRIASMICTSLRTSSSKLGRRSSSKASSPRARLGGVRPLASAISTFCRKSNASQSSAVRSSQAGGTAAAAFALFLSGTSGASVSIRKRPRDVTSKERILALAAANSSASTVKGTCSSVAAAMASSAKVSTSLAAPEGSESSKAPPTSTLSGSDTRDASSSCAPRMETPATSVMAMLKLWNSDLPVVTRRSRLYKVSRLASGVSARLRGRLSHSPPSRVTSSATCGLVGLSKRSRKPSSTGTGKTSENRSSSSALLQKAQGPSTPAYLPTPTKRI